ncbi:MAG: hypothetical protein GY772_21805 [bacterium]|nr:hypothetical protein [bacterium]MCP4389979.1 hypothetical protein [Gammaproteobacteria bacterium]MCP5091956.1 hypothetical protein [Gammaproteobacteria bacterium]
MSRAGESRKIAADHATRYETLRAYAIERHAPPSRDGLVILLRHGVAAWMDAWSKLPAWQPQPVQADPHKLPPIFDNASVDVVHVLATMTLSHFQELYP